MVAVINALITGKQHCGPPCLRGLTHRFCEQTPEESWLAAQLPVKQRVVLAMQLPAGTSPGGGVAKALTQFGQPLAHPDAVCGAQMTERLGQLFREIVRA
ncbi:conserved hypothetical protein [Ricinus communis]|uniref:Uncharacterized protein n=1 Tax=Ricinus communis TaxID=3988 RepID=B9TBG3_RICCO|nr:conserved hypothetical protein [Ricinus communis]